MHISNGGSVVNRLIRYHKIPTPIAYATKVWMSMGLPNRITMPPLLTIQDRTLMCTGVAARCGGPSVVWSLQYSQSFRILCSSAQEEACNHRCDHSESGSLNIHYIESKDRQNKKTSRV